jgi:hypothetical protein
MMCFKSCQTFIIFLKTRPFSAWMPFFTENISFKFKSTTHLDLFPLVLDFVLTLDYFIEFVRVDPWKCLDSARE